MFATSKTVSVAPCLSPTKFIVSSTLLHSNVFQLFPTTRCKKTWNTSSFGRVVVVPSALCIWSKAPATHLSHSCTTNSSPALFFTTTLFFKYSPPPLDSSNNWIMAFPSAPNIHWALQTLTTIPLGNKMYLQWKKSTITTSLCPDVCDLATSWETGKSWRQPVVKFFSSCLVHSPLGRDPDFMSR